MKNYLIAAVALTWLTTAQAQTPMGRPFGIGIILGDPTGLTFKFAAGNGTDLSLSAGSSYFGAPRFGADYTWHIYSFRDAPVHLYAGPGIGVGVGSGDGWWYRNSAGRFYNRSSGVVGLGMRGIFGANVNLRNDPIEFFFELGPMIGISPAFGSTVEMGIGVRFYP
jgi:hypothetical protein